MIVDGSLKVSGRKRVQIITDLKDKEFMTFVKPNTATASAESTSHADEQMGEADVPNESEHGYDYLLSVRLSQLVANVRCKFGL